MKVQRLIGEYLFTKILTRMPYNTIISIEDIV
jgi:hypothetical protein